MTRRIGVVLNQTTCTYYFYTLLSDLSLSGDSEFYFLIYSQSHLKRTCSLWNGVKWVENQVISWFEPDIRRFNQIQSVLSLSHHDVVDLSNKSGFLQLKALDLDIIVQDPSIGPIISLLAPYSKQGVFSLSLGNNEYSYFYELFIFWAVYLQQTSIAFQVINQTTPSHDTKIVLSGNLPVQGSYTETLECVMKRSYAYVLQVIRNNDLRNDDSVTQQVKIKHSLNVKMPLWYHSLHYLGQIITRGIANIINNRSGGMQWGVAFLKQPLKQLGQDAQLSNGIRIKNPSQRWFADPFVVTRNNRTICFVEDYWNQKQRACITAVELFEDNQYHILGPVLEEPFHMSFPYIFEYENDFYMVPETSESNEIRLYKCVDFPLKWEYQKSLITDIFAADTMILNREGMWWLLTNVPVKRDSNHCYQLNIYYSTDPIDGEWIPHHHNPVLVDSMTARNGGVIYERVQELPIRCRQKQGFDCYGKGLTLAKIVELTPEIYLEEQIANIEPDFFNGIVGAHHLHSDGVYTVYDYRLQ